MFTSVVLGYALVADSGMLVVVGAAITAIGGIVAAVLTNSSANRRQRRELQYRGRKSSMAGPLFITTVALAVVVVALSTRPDEKPKVASAPPTLPTTLASVVSTAPPAVEPTAAPTAAAAAEAPITVEEASAFVTSYLENATREATEEQAWAMFTDNHKLVFTRGLDEFRDFWRSVDTVKSIATPVLTLESATRARLVTTLNYKLLQANKDGVDCTEEDDTFTLVRVNGALQIDGYKAHLIRSC
jgi:hypothetical protein